MAAKMKIDTAEFDRTMRKYLSLSKKGIAEVVNKKAYFIAVGALKATPIANKNAIGRWVRDWNKSAATIIKTYGLKRPFDKKDAIKKYSKYRKRTVAYLRAGWIMAIRMLGRAAKMPRRVKGAVMKGRPKGSARFANSKSWSPTATIINSTGFSSKQAKALKQYGAPALAAAFHAEMASMKKYIEDKLKKTARKSGIRRVK